MKYDITMISGKTFNIETDKSIEVFVKELLEPTVSIWTDIYGYVVALSGQYVESIIQRH
jgi:hypothetical protein